MTTPTPRPAKTMTQVMRPTCEVIGAPEVHSYIGPGINNFGSPCLMRSPMALWWSDGTAWDAEKDTTKKSTTVFAANDPLLKQGAQAKGRRHHLVMAVGVSILPPAPMAVSGATGVRLPGQWVSVMDQDKGESLTIFAPRHVKADIAGEQEVAVLRWPGGGAMGPGNLSVCCDPIDHPLTFAHQSPNSVFLGMTRADTIGSMVGWFATALANALLKMVIERSVSWLSKRLARWFSRQILRAASRAVREFLRVLRALGVRGFEPAAQWVAKNGLAAVFNVEEARFDHTTIDDHIADFWDTHMETP